jgi:hypothetical protein
MDHQLVTRLRAALLALVFVGMTGMATELVLLKHYEDTRQLVPLFLIVLAYIVLGMVTIAPSALSVRAFQAVMALFVAAGALGVYFHLRGSIAFQLDMDPTQSRWDLFSKAIRAQAPPALAPGAISQLGLLGLVAAYRHPKRGHALTPNTGAPS